MTLASLGCSVALMSNAGPALCQAWPARTVTVTVVAPFAAGSAADVLARVALEQVSKQVGRPIVVENRFGRERLATLGVEPMPMSMEQFAAYFRKDVLAHVKIVQAAKIPALQ